MDRSGDAYVTSWSGAFPTTPGAYKTGTYGGAFVAKLNATGSALVYAAQIGGSGGGDKGYRIAVDAWAMLMLRVSPIRRTSRRRPVVTRPLPAVPRMPSSRS